MGMGRIVIPGGSGFIGDYASQYFVTLGYEVVVLSRTKEGIHNKVHYVYWNARTLGEWIQFLDGSLAILNLTGRSIDCVFTSKHQKEILDSRVDSTKVLLEACLQCVNPPVVFIQSSSIGYYGNTTALCSEESPNGSDFLAEVCSDWEKTFFGVNLPDTRKVLFRFGVVLGKDGGAYNRILPWINNYLGGQLGNGQQFISWIHQEDLVRLVHFAITHSDVDGKYNATSDLPVTNAVFMRIFRFLKKRPWAMPVPSLFVKIGAALFMHTNADVVLHGVPCTSTKIIHHGFVFKYPNLTVALSNLLSHK